MLSRRQFLARSGAAGAVVLAPQALLPDLASARKAPLLGSGKFAEGIASGDPAPHGVTLWTRIADLERKGAVRLEVARDKGFRRVIASTRIGTGPDQGGSVKARVTGLRPYEQYYYRFETKTSHSEVGRFRTAPPADSNQPLTFAFFSCQDYTHGFYNAHEVMADEDLDFVVCLGDYIYAETYHTLAGGTAVRDDEIGSPGYARHPADGDTLEHYRAKYALYRRDKSLRAVHAKAPMMVVWDDHEVQDNYAGAAPGGGLPPEQRYSRSARAPATRVVRVDADLLPGGATGSTAGCASARRGPDHARPAPATAATSRAATRSCRLAPSCTAARLPRPRADGLGQAPARRPRRPPGR